MTLLEAVNHVLVRLGETPVSSVHEQYPTLALVLPALEDARRKVLTAAWWFNTYPFKDLLPDSQGNILTPSNYLEVIPHDSNRYMWTGSRIVHATDGNPDMTGHRVQARVALDLPFEELPPVAQSVVAEAAALYTYISDFGPDNTSESIESNLGELQAALHGQHVRTTNRDSRVHRVRNRLNGRRRR